MVTMLGRKRRGILFELAKKLQKTISLAAVAEAATISILYIVYTLVAAFIITLVQAMRTFMNVEPG